MQIKHIIRSLNGKTAIAEDTHIEWVRSADTEDSILLSPVSIALCASCRLCRGRTDGQAARRAGAACADLRSHRRRVATIASEGCQPASNDPSPPPPPPSVEKVDIHGWPAKMMTSSLCPMSYRKTHTIPSTVRAVLSDSYWPHIALN